MGFLNPGQKSKRSRSHTPTDRKKPSKKRIKLETSSIITKTPKLPKITKPKASIIERLPTEIVQEIFIFSNNLNLPFVSKILHDQLIPSKSLKKSLLKNAIMDLNTGIKPSDMKYDKRYALDKEILRYRFVDSEMLKEVTFDTVLPVTTIAAESKNRLILYYDKLNQKLLETMRRAESTEEEINRELARIADENFNNINRGDAELEDAPEEEVQDFPERFYEGPFTTEKQECIRLLHEKGLKFVNSDTIFESVMNSRSSMEVLELVNSCRETDTEESVKPLISAFETNNKEYVQWVIDTIAKDLLNNDELWIYIYKRQDMELLHYLEEQGGTPSHDVLQMLSSLRND